MRATISMSLISTMLMVASLSLAGCSISESSLSDQSARGDGLIVVLGGRTSCQIDVTGELGPYAMDMYGPFAELLQAVQATGRQPHWLISCYDRRQLAAVVTSLNPRQLSWMNNNQLAQAMWQLRQQVRGGPVTLLGHSWGGWFALSQAPVLDADLVVSIDPISQQLCRVGRPRYCRGFPADLELAGLGPQLAERGTRWHNYYQTENRLLHSGEALGAVNEWLPVPHVDIDTHPKPWQLLWQVQGL